MSDVAVRVEGLGKQYKLGGRGQPAYKSLRESLMNAATAPFRGARDGHEVGDGEREFWALKDVSFEVKHGEVLGIIGRNGAGKSTLLKILSRITEPTAGYADVYGRVGALLEVGTGFHPELTGAENIYLSGAILGMSRVDIKRRFDEIVAFAELEQFLETPVKRYSSGMYMRLAFSVAAHLEPEVLVVDEVLAVGDAEFQKRCLGKMGEVAGEGRTVLFVSHNMAAVQKLCGSGLVLSYGRTTFQGAIHTAVQHYMRVGELRTGLVDLSSATNRFGSGEMRILRFWVEDELGSPVPSVPSGAHCRLAIEYVSVDGRQRRDVAMSVVINTSEGMPVSLVNTYMLNQDFPESPPRGIIRFEIPKLPLTAGRYVVDLNLATYGGHTYADFVKGAAAFDVDEGDFYGSGRPGNSGAPIMIEGAWRIDEIGEEHERNGCDISSAYLTGQLKNTPAR